MSDDWVPIYSEQDSPIVHGKLVSFGVPAVLLTDNPGRLAGGVGVLVPEVVYVPPDRVAEAREILGFGPLPIEEPEDQARLLELARLGRRIQVCALISLCGVPLLASVPGAWWGQLYLNGVFELRGRPRGHRLALLAMAICVLAIPVGIGLIVWSMS